MKAHDKPTTAAPSPIASPATMSPSDSVKARNRQLRDSFDHEAFSEKLREKAMENLKYRDQ